MSETLQDLVLRRLLELGGGKDAMSAREAVRRADVEGLSYESLRKIARGEHSGRLTDRTANALAAVLEVPIKVVYEAAGITMPDGPWPWPDRFARLSQPRRRLVEDVAAALLDEYERGRREAAGDA